MESGPSYHDRSLFVEPESEEEKKALFKKYVNNVILEISAHCNRKCSYCPVSESSRGTSRAILQDEIFEVILRNLKSIDYSESICLNLYNEPTSDKPLLLGRIHALRQALPESRIYFSTNGDYLDVGYLEELIRAGLSELYVTLHPPAGKPYSDTYAATRFCEFSVRFGKAIKVSSFIPNHTLQGSLRFGDITLNVFSTNYYDFGTDRAGLVTDSVRTATKRTAPCERPFRDFTVSYDGTVFPCCQMFVDNPDHKRQFSIGRISINADIFETYASMILARWRASLLRFEEKAHPCSTCNDGNRAGTPEEILDRDLIYKELVGPVTSELRQRKAPYLIQLLKRLSR